MKVYLAVWRMNFMNGLQYRAAAVAGLLTQIFFGFVFIMVYAAFYKSSSAKQPMNWQQVVSYVWLTQIFLSLIVFWVRNMQLFQLITDGNLAYELTRPVAIYPLWYMRLLGERMINALLRSVLIIPIVLFLPEKYRLQMPDSTTHFLLFIVALTISTLLVVAISMYIYISVFWTMNPTGSMLIIAIIAEFLAGLIIPVPLMPSWLQQLTYLLPFRFTADFPFRIYSGHIGIPEALIGVGIQLLWLVFIVITGYWLMKKALRQVVIQGG
ncbi:ABC transporter permease [Paenibacillus yanchengensis]|uniref:ABC transporter permease n=1 Tax=Paenibacillus yanchengensis TaxID=2035833 RepID=A0ABW4YFG8_9BACL